MTAVGLRVWVDCAKMERWDRSVGCVWGAEWMLDKVGMKQRELGWVGINVRFKKVGHNHRVRETKCLEGRLADWLTCTGMLMSAGVRMSNLMMLSYVVFAVSGFCFSIIGYLSVFILLTTSVFCMHILSLQLFCSVLISELILTLHWLHCTISFMWITYCIVHSSLCCSTTALCICWCKFYDLVSSFTFFIVCFAFWWFLEWILVHV